MKASPGEAWGLPTSNFARGSKVSSAPTPLLELVETGSGSSPPVVVVPS